MSSPCASTSRGCSGCAGRADTCRCSASMAVPLISGIFRGSFSCYDMTMSIMPAAVLTGLSIVVNMRCGAAAVNIFYYKEWGVLGVSALQMLLNLYLTLFRHRQHHHGHRMAQHPLHHGKKAAVRLHLPRVHAYLRADSDESLSSSRPSGRISTTPARWTCATSARRADAPFNIGLNPLYTCFNLMLHNNIVLKRGRCYHRR